MEPIDPHEPYGQAGPRTDASGRQGPIRGDSRNLWVLGLLGTFPSITVVAIVFRRDEPHIEPLTTPMWPSLLGLAAIRIGRIIARDEATQPFRAPSPARMRSTGGTRKSPDQAASAARWVRCGAARTAALVSRRGPAGSAS